MRLLAISLLVGTFAALCIRRRVNEASDACPMNEVERIVCAYPCDPRLDDLQRRCEFWHD